MSIKTTTPYILVRCEWINNIDHVTAVGRVTMAGYTTVHWSSIVLGDMLNSLRELWYDIVSFIILNRDLVLNLLM